MHIYYISITICAVHIVTRANIYKSKTVLRGPLTTVSRNVLINWINHIYTHLYIYADILIGADSFCVLLWSFCLEVGVNLPFRRFKTRTSTYLVIEIRCDTLDFGHVINKFTGWCDVLVVPLDTDIFCDIGESDLIVSISFNSHWLTWGNGTK